MKAVFALFFAVILLISVIPSVNADLSKKQKEALKGDALERKIDVLLVMCKQVDFAGAWKYCFTKGYDIYRDRDYRFVDAPYKVLFESKLHAWAQKIKI